MSAQRGTDRPSRREDLLDWSRFFAAESYLLKERPALLFQQAANQPASTTPAHMADARLAASLERRPWLRWINKPERSRARLLTLIGHLGTVKACAFSPDGRRIVSGADDQTVRVWDAATGAALLVLSGHRFHVESFAFLPDGRRIVTCGGEMKLWDIETGVELATLLDDVGTSVHCAVAPDGQRVVVVSYSVGMRLIDIPSGLERRRLDGASVWRHAEFSPDGRRIACAGSKGRLELRDATTLDVIHEWQAHEKVVTACAFSPDGARLVSASSDTLKIWDVDRAVTLLTLAGGAGDCAFSPDGRHVVSASGTLRIWDAASGMVRAVLRDRSRIEACAYSPDGTRIVSACADTLSVWDATTTDVEYIPRDSVAASEAGRKGAVFFGLASNPEVRWCSFAPHGRTVASATLDGTVDLWDVASGTHAVRLDAHSDRVTSCAFAPDGGRVATASFDRTLRLWDVKSGQSMAILEGHTGAVTACAYAPDGRLIVSSATDHTLRVWDGTTGRPLRILHGHEGTVHDCAISPDGSLIASASDDGTIRTWRPGGGGPVLVVRGQRAADPDRSSAHRRMRDERHSVFETVTLRGHRRGGFLRCTFTPDGSRIVSLTAEQHVRIWDAKTGAEVQPPLKPGKVVPLSPLVRRFEAMFQVGLYGRSGSFFETYAVSPDGTRIAAATITMEAAGYERGGSIGVWALDSGEELLVLSSGVGYRIGVVACAFSPGGLLATGAQDGRITIWDATSGRAVGALRVEGEAAALAWSPTGEFLAVGDAAGVVRILRLENAPDAPIVAVPWQRPRGFAFFQREREADLAFGCPACRGWSTTQAEPGAVLPCPRCARPLRLAPFVIEGDWQPVAGAWRGRKDGDAAFT